MAALADIRALLDKGPDLRAPDIDELRALLAMLPVDDQTETERWVWEAVALIVNDPLYRGGAELPNDIDELVNSI